MKERIPQNYYNIQQLEKVANIISKYEDGKKCIPDE